MVFCPLGAAGFAMTVSTGISSGASAVSSGDSPFTSSSSVIWYNRESAISRSKSGSPASVSHLLTA